MNGFWQLRDAHTESAINLLPTKVLQLSENLVNPVLNGMALAMGTVVGNDSSIHISNAKNMFFLRFYHLL